MRHSGWLDVGLALAVIGVAAAAGAGTPAWVLLVFLTGALCGYDLVLFRGRLLRFEPEQRERVMRAHLVGLAVMAALGLLLGSAALLLRTSYGFAGLTLLAFVGLLALARAMRRVRLDQVEIAAVKAE